MKKVLLLLIVTALIFSLFSFSALASSHTTDDVTIDLSDKFLVFTPNTEKSEFEKFKGAEAFINAFENDKELLFIATTDGLQSQLLGRKTQTEFSKETETLTGLTDETMRMLAEQISSLKYEGVYTTNGINFLRFTNEETEYHTTVFVTVENGFLYTFNYYGNDSFVSAEMLNGITIATDRKASSLTVKATALIVVVWIVIIAVCVFLILLIVSTIKEYRERHNENDVSNYIKIKRRIR